MERHPSGPERRAVPGPGKSVVVVWTLLSVSFGRAHAQQSPGCGMAPPSPGSKVRRKFESGVKRRTRRASIYFSCLVFFLSWQKHPFVSPCWTPVPSRKPKAIDPVASTVLVRNTSPRSRMRALSAAVRLSSCEHVFHVRIFVLCVVGSRHWRRATRSNTWGREALPSPSPASHTEGPSMPPVLLVWLA